MADKLDKALAKLRKANRPENKEAARLAKMARVKPPRMYGDMAGDVTVGLGRSRKDMESVARGGKKMKYGGKVSKMEEGGKVLSDADREMYTAHPSIDGPKRAQSEALPFGKPKTRKTREMPRGKMNKNIRKYKDGGEVCRGGGKAIAGTKFRGVK